MIIRTTINDGFLCGVEALTHEYRKRWTKKMKRYIVYEGAY